MARTLYEFLCEKDYAFKAWDHGQSNRDIVDRILKDVRAVPGWERITEEAFLEDFNLYLRNEGALPPEDALIV